MKYRQDRINESVAQTVGEILRSVKDPRISSGFVTVNAASVTKDLKYANIYFGVLCGEIEEVEKGLKSANGYIRRELALRLNLRVTPELNFIYDNSAEHGARIAAILKKLENTSEDNVNE